jgi:hypothetical protein
MQCTSTLAVVRRETGGGSGPCSSSHMTARLRGRIRGEPARLAWFEIRRPRVKEDPEAAEGAARARRGRCSRSRRSYPPSPVASRSRRLRALPASAPVPRPCRTPRSIARRLRGALPSASWRDGRGPPRTFWPAERPAPSSRRRRDPRDLACIEPWQCSEDSSARCPRRG